MSDQWEGGFIADVTITNPGPAINGWTLAWSFSGSQRITNLWNGVLTQNNSSVNVRNADHNASIPTGGSVSFGFQASYPGPNTGLTVFTFNGAAITTPTLPPAPAAPSALVATAASASQINLAWADNANNESSFRVERSTDGNSFSLLATLNANTSSYSSTGLAASTRYFYRVRALNAGGVSAPSAIAGAVTSSTGALPTLKLQYQQGDNDSWDNQLQPRFQIVNTGQSSIALSDLTIRYWFTSDGTQPQNFWCDWAGMGASNVSGAFAKRASASASADTSLEVRFQPGAGSVAPGGNSGSINTRVAKSDWSGYNETNDYSYDAAKTSLTDAPRVTLYYKGALVWGTEP